MDDDFETHLFTERGALCGAAMPFAWAWRESRVTCSMCRAALERGSGPRHRALPKAIVARTKDVEPE